jgi:MFS family permease
MLLMARAPVDGSFLIDLAVPMLLLGIAAGVFFMPLFLIATAEAGPSDSGLVSGLVGMSQLIGGAVGLAVLAGVAAIRSGGLLAGGAEPQTALNEGYHAAFLVAAALSLITTIITATQLQDPKVPATASVYSSS